mgnify:CR=1 FL=1
MKKAGAKRGKGQFRQGHDTRRNITTPGSGRPPIAIRQECARLINEITLPKMRAYVDTKGPNDAGFRWCQEQFAKLAQFDQQVIEHTGDVDFTIRLFDAHR